MDHPLMVGPLVALGMFVVLMLMREAAVAYGDRWSGLPIARIHWTSLAVMAMLAAAAVLWMAGYW